MLQILSLILVLLVIPTLVIYLLKKMESNRVRERNELLRKRNFSDYSDLDGGEFEKLKYYLDRKIRFPRGSSIKWLPPAAFGSSDSSVVLFGMWGRELAGVAFLYKKSDFNGTSGEITRFYSKVEKDRQGLSFVNEPWNERFQKYSIRFVGIDKNVLVKNGDFFSALLGFDFDYLEFFDEGFMVFKIIDDFASELDVSQIRKALSNSPKFEQLIGVTNNQSCN